MTQRKEGNIISDIQSLENKPMEWAKIEACTDDWVSGQHLSGSLPAMAGLPKTAAAVLLLARRPTDDDSTTAEATAITAGLNSLKASGERAISISGSRTRVDV
ncbi:MAG: hypothetical protein U0892_10375 [Pirellulales bacterium]